MVTLADTNQDADPVDYKQASIHIIDDEEIILETTGLLLRSGGFTNISLFRNAVAAVEQMKKSPPDLILTDIHMPEISGGFLISFIRSFPQLYQIPIIVITADYSDRSVANVMFLGATHCLAKPIEEAALISTVTTAITTSITTAVTTDTRKTTSAPAASERESRISTDLPDNLF